MEPKEIRAMMDQKRNGQRFGDLVIATMVKDTEKKMDQWDLFTASPAQSAPLSVDEVFDSLKG